MFKANIDGVEIGVSFSYPEVVIKKAKVALVKTADKRIEDREVYAEIVPAKTRKETHCTIRRLTGEKMTTADLLGYGIAKYNPKDQKSVEFWAEVNQPKMAASLVYERYRGRKIAFGRALDQAFGGKENKEFRKLLWNLFLQSNKESRRIATSAAPAVS